MYEQRVLIETYWNIKGEYFDVKKIFKGINRNILEYKGLCLKKFLRAQVVLIETYWNIKYCTVKVSPSVTLVLIETYWNVKSVQDMDIRTGVLY